MVIVAVSTIFVQIMNTQKRVSIENYLITESRFLTERIVREIRKGTIDYEQYYRKNLKPTADTTYAKGYGTYAQQFFDPGSDTTTYKYGYNCGGTCTSSENIDQSSIDIDTGENPWDAVSDTEIKQATAFTNKSTAPTNVTHQSNELYLIDSLGRTRTYFSFASSKIYSLQLEGADNDQNGVPETWTCGQDWLNYQGIADTECKYQKSSNTDSINTTDFINITPDKIKITNLKFTIYPLEDPYKAFWEEKKLRAQPRVTINMTVEPSNDDNFYKGAVPKINIQTTVSSQVYYNIPSYNKFCDNVNGSVEC